MRYNLSNFYKSKEWYGLLQTIKFERVNEDGFICCEHCNKPIIKAYDCIGHHVIPLTEENVNDARISLNPELIALVHHKCHNKIHNKLGGMAYSDRRVYVVYGSPLSGKSTYVNDSKLDDDLVIDMDSIWSCIQGNTNKGYYKPNRLLSTAFGVRNYLLECVRYRRGKWRNAYVIGGYPLISERERLIKELDAEEIFINTSREECIERLENCHDGRNKDEWLKYIDDWWRKYAPQAYIN